MRIATALLGLLLPVVTCAAPMYRVDLKVTEKGRTDEQPLTMLLEGGKEASMEIGGPDGGRRYELRVDGDEGAKGRPPSATVHLRVFDVTPRGRKELGSDDVKFERLGWPVAWQPKKRVKGLDIQVTLFRQPM